MDRKIAPIPDAQPQGPSHGGSGATGPGASLDAGLALWACDMEREAVPDRLQVLAERLRAALSRSLDGPPPPRH